MRGQWKWRLLCWTNWLPDGKFDSLSGRRDVVHTITPKVSVVMSVCDGERYLHDSVESICNQTLDDFELIVVDDGSTAVSSTHLTLTPSDLE